MLQCYIYTASLLSMAHIFFQKFWDFKHYCSDQIRPNFENRIRIRQYFANRTWIRSFFENRNQTNKFENLNKGKISAGPKHFVLFRHFTAIQIRTRFFLRVGLGFRKKQMDSISQDERSGSDTCKLFTPCFLQFFWL